MTILRPEHALFFSLFFVVVAVWRPYCEPFGESFNKHPNRSCAERGPAVERQKYAMGKRLRSEIALELLQE